ncbi:hypothetical protein C8J98_10323 [Luteibacter sp. OK325]|jgi:hypothetical protein|uniref:hypothetical protein n=1 Tax=Luteibacter sp. OK325 TaxID=2135670 RepID=UPI000D35ECEB|nr:hypothetical protein [Luteibacter sp. OK325]PTR33266.1 hypothetical protein C8J98_10323 [Luteibacter sp. OK325]
MPNHRIHRTHVALAAIFTACVSTAAYATPPGQEPPPPSFGVATPSEQLQDMSGGTNTTNNVNNQTLNGTMSDTEAKDNLSGNNIVSGSAFGSSAGLPTVIQNSGNNVLIQNATIVNIRMNP